MQKQIFKIFLLLIWGTFFCVPKVFASLNVPLTVQEALPAGVTGINRTNEPVTVGIPLAEDSGITDVSQLGLSGTSAGQFRALAHWPNGNIKWVLTDFQASVAAGQTNTNVSLTDGSGNFGGNDLATDNGTNISVNTTAGQFTIKKANFNVFDQVVVDGQTLVDSGNSGGVRGKDLSGVDYSSINDAGSTAVIEENGPLRTVVKTTGSLKDSNGNWLLDYVLRIHFYKGKSYVKAFAALADANVNHKIKAPFNNFEIVVPINITGTKNATFTRMSDTVSANLAAGTSAYLFQGWNNKYDVQEQGYCMSWHPPIAGNSCTTDTAQYASTSMGLTIQNDATVLNASGDETQYSLGWAEFKDASGKGVTELLRWMPAYWPTGFEFNDSGETSIELYSKHQAGVQLKMQFQTHDTREIMWDFHTSVFDNNQAFYRLHYPLIARADFSQYQNSKVFYDQSEFVSAAQQAQFFDDISGGKVSSSIMTNPTFSRVYRAWSWGSNAADHQFDFDLDWIMNFLRSGLPGWFLNGESSAIFKNDSGVARSDNFGAVYTETPADPVPAAYAVSSRSMNRDMEHANIMVLPIYYYMTGNEDIKDGMIDYGEQSQAEEVASKFPIPDAAHNYSTQGTPYFRAYVRRMKNFAIAYKFTCEVGACNDWYKNIVSEALNQLLDIEENYIPTGGSTLGRNFQRGYIWRDSTLGSHMIHGLFQSQMAYEAFWQVFVTMQNTSWNYSRMLDFQDMLLGLSQFYFNEWTADSGDTNSQNFANDFGFDSDYRVDTPQDYYVLTNGSWVNQHVPATNESMLAFWLVPYEAGRAARFGYYLTGDNSMLTKAYKLNVGTAKHASGHHAAEMQEQSLMWLYFNKNAVKVWNYVNLNVQNNGGGSYTLSWTVPQGAQQYQIKYADKPIVDWLGFNRFTRVFQYDPASHAPFFAASNINNNPAPQAGGTTQTFTVTGLNAATDFYFSLKALTPADQVAPNNPQHLSVN